MNFEKMFTTIDTHVAGEAFRIVLHSSIMLSHESVESADDELQSNFNNEKNLLLNEPRGHRGMHGCIITPSKVADYRLLFFNHKDVSNFKYEGLVATLTALLEMGNLKRSADDLYKIETVDEIYTVKATIENEEVTAVYIESKASSKIESNVEYVSVRVDNARNYLLFTLPDSIPGIELQHLAALNNWGLKKVGELTKANVDYEGIVLIESGLTSPNKVRTVTFEKDGYILRSPGIDSSIAILTSILDSLGNHNELENESVYGSSLSVKVLSEEGDLRFSVETEAFVTGSHQFIFDRNDPLKDGFLLA